MGEYEPLSVYEELFTRAIGITRWPVGSLSELRDMPVDEAVEECVAQMVAPTSS